MAEVTGGTEPAGRTEQTEAGGAADGRVARGRRRRAELLAAALRVAERDGVAAVTHRAVAKEAGLADTAGTYYFRTVDELLIAVITTGAQRFADSVRTELPADPRIRDLAELTASYLTEHRGRAIAEYELYLLAARRPELRPAARLWLDAARELLSRWTTEEATLRAALALCDGVLLQGLIADEPPDAEEIARVFEPLLGR